MNENDKNFESNIRKIFIEEIEVPYHTKNTIMKTLQEQKEKSKKKKKKINIIRTLATACACCVLVTGVVFAKDITNMIKNFFLNNNGMDNAIENGYIDNPNMEYINSNGTEIKINSILMDDYNLSLEIGVKGDFIKENITEICFPDMIITDENKNILYCEDKDTFEKYVKDNNLDYNWKDNNVHYLNSGSNWYIKSINESTINLVYNLFADNQYPKSQKLFINLNKILFSDKGKEKMIQGDWNIEYEVPEKFYNREEIIYNVKNCSSDKVKLVQLVISQTTAKMQLITDEKPILPYDLNDDDATKERKIQEELEREQNMTVQDFENSRKFKDEYIENDKGEKFYPSNSTSEDTGYSYIDMKYLLHWQTFSLNKYSATNSLKLYLNYNGEDIVIELER